MELITAVARLTNDRHCFLLLSFASHEQLPYFLIVKVISNVFSLVPICPKGQRQVDSEDPSGNESKLRRQTSRSCRPRGASSLLSAAAVTNYRTRNSFPENRELSRKFPVKYGYCTFRVRDEYIRGNVRS